MIPPAQYLRDIAAQFVHGVKIDYVHGRYVAGKLVDIATQDERDAHEMRDAAVQLLAEIATLGECTPDQRASLRRHANLFAKMADRRAPNGSVFDPDGEPETATVLQFTNWPRPAPIRAVVPVAAVEDGR